MSNAGTKKSRDRNRNDTDTASIVTGKPITNGGSVRSDDGDKQATAFGSSSGESGTLANNGVASGLSSGYTRNEIASGYYFTPDGTIKPIPEGYYIDARDGRLKKHRQRRDTDNAYDRNESNGNGETSNDETESSSPTTFRKPLTVRGRRKQKTVKEETKKLTMLTLIASGCGALFTSVALLTKHDHWALRTDCQPTEAKILAEAINDALDTLPAKYYDVITSIVEKWIPWVNLIFVLSALIFDRIEQSNKLIEQAERANYIPRERSDERNAASGAKTGTFGSATSLGYGQ